MHLEAKILKQKLDNPSDFHRINSFFPYFVHHTLTMKHQKT